MLDSPKVDLGCEIEVHDVTLHFRRDCCFDNNEDVEVRVGTVSAEVDAKANTLVGDTETTVQLLASYQVGMNWGLCRRDIEPK